MIEEIVAHYAPRLGLGYDIRSNDHWSYPIHRHVKTCDLNVCLWGEVEHCVNGETTILRPGQILWVRDGDIHTVQGRNFQFLNLNVTQSVLELLAEGMAMHSRYREYLAPKGPQVFDLGDRKDLIIEKYYQFTEKQLSDDAPILLRSLLAEVLTVFFLKRTADKGPSQAWLADLCGHIELNLNRVTAGDLAELAGRSASHISRSFKAEFGLTPSQYINRLRVERAAKRLAASNETISQICFDVGFFSLSYFYRLFHAQKGMTPVEFRREHNMFFRGS